MTFTSRGDDDRSSAPHGDPHADALDAVDRLAVLDATGLVEDSTAFRIPTLDRVARLVAIALHAPIAQVNVVSDRAQVPTAAYVHDTTAEPGQPWRSAVPLDASYCQHVVRSGAPLVIDDAPTHPLVADNRATREAGIGAYIGVPLVAPGGDVLGSVCAVDVVARHWTPAEIVLLKECAGVAAEEVAARLGAARALGERDTRLRLAVDGARLGTWTLDGDPPTLAASGHFKAHHGRASDAAFPLDEWLAAVDPHDRTSVRAAIERLQAGGVDEMLEYRVALPGGETCWIGAYAHAIVDAAEAPARVVGVTIDMTARVRAEHALRASEERYALAARATSNVVWDWDPRGDVLTWSDNFTALYGYEPEALSRLQAWLDTVHPDDQDEVRRTLDVAIDDAAGQAEWSAGYRFRRGDGTYAAVLDRGFISRDPSGRVTRMIGAMEDVTSRSELDAQLRQAQKMEALGQLAGGIAHDFNNLLAVIGGNVDFALEDLHSGPAAAEAVRADLEEVGEATERARTLVRQLLTFSRRQAVQRRDVRLPEAVLSAQRLLRRVIGEEIALEVQVVDPAATAYVDPGQLDQMLLNLALNARDAMLTPRHGHPGTGGVLHLAVDTIDAAHVPADALLPPPTTTLAGRWVRLRVRDTGHGIDAATRARIFEPFFTTKDPGSGTGLGLATVFGLVRQNGGYLQVESTPGKGTTFTIVFPAVAAPDAAPSPVAPIERALGPGATVLLVEDDTGLRVTLRRMLERQGHRVVEARDGGEALAVWRAYAPAVEVLVADLRLPEMDGRDLARRLRTEAPGLAVVYMTGYPPDRVDAGEPGAVQLQKPFSGDDLGRAIASALGVN